MLLKANNGSKRSMLIIREAQMRALEQHAEEDFVRRLTKYLSALEARGRDSDPVPFVRAGIAYAREYYFTKENDIVRFLTIIWRYFGHFPEFPRPVLSILYTYTSDTAEKLARFEQWAVQESAKTYGG